MEPYKAKTMPIDYSIDKEMLKLSHSKWNLQIDTNWRNSDFSGRNVLPEIYGKHWWQQRNTKSKKQKNKK